MRGIAVLVPLSKGFGYERAEGGDRGDDDPKVELDDSP